MNAESDQKTPISKEIEGESGESVGDLVWRKWTGFMKAHPLWGSVVAVLGLLLIVVTFLTQLHFVTRTLFGDGAGDAVVGIVVVVLSAWSLIYLLILRDRNAARNSGPTMPTEAEKAPPAKQSSAPTEWYNSKWLPLIVCGWLIYQNMNRPNRHPVQPIAPANNQQIAGQKQQRQNATLTYWHTAVANLHGIRFDTPSGDEPAKAYYERMCAELLNLINRVEAASTANVDSDLVALARRHLLVERQFLQLKARIDTFMAQENHPEGTDSITDRVKQAQEIFTPLLEDPSLLEKLPEGELRSVIKGFLETFQQREDQLHQIEIMQAVLQERYPGIKFSLPEVKP